MHFTYCQMNFHGVVLCFMLFTSGHQHLLGNYSYKNTTNHSFLPNKTNHLPNNTNHIPNKPQLPSQQCKDPGLQLNSHQLQSTELIQCDVFSGNSLLLHVVCIIQLSLFFSYSSSFVFFCYLKSNFWQVWCEKPTTYRHL